MWGGDPASPAVMPNCSAGTGCRVLYSPGSSPATIATRSRGRNMLRATFSALGLLLFLSGRGSSASAPSKPDLTGIWTLDAQGKAGAALTGVGGLERTAPFTPLAREKLAAYHALVDSTRDSPGAHCVTHGMPLAIFLGGGYPVEFIQRPEQLTIIYETHNEVRRVFLDGRRVDPADILPSR